jgi:hypothetical protein
MPRRSTGIFQQSELQEKFRRFEEQLKLSRKPGPKSDAESAGTPAEPGEADTAEPKTAPDEPES